MRVSDQGVSRPFVCRDEIGEVRWCKGNHTGLRAVMCEWICARIASRLELPVPDARILTFDIGRFRSWQADQRLPTPDLVTAANPSVFGSRNVDGVKDVFDPANELGHIDRRLLARIFMFDRLIRNTDRVDANSNLLVNGGVYIIDHNNAFDPDFDEASFAAEHVLREAYAESTAEERGGFANLIRARLSESFLDEIWSEMPEAWTDLGGEVLGLDAVKGIVLEKTHG